MDFQVKSEPVTEFLVKLKDDANQSQHNSEDDEDSDNIFGKNMTYRDRRREAHTHAEQKRRNSIKRGYDELSNLVPRCQSQDNAGMNGVKLSKAAILQRSIEYMQYLLQQRARQQDKLDTLKKDVMALKIMKANYEHIVATQRQQAADKPNNLISDETKFAVFSNMMDILFDSFDRTVSFNSFAELSGCMFSWLEEFCNAMHLQQVAKQSTSKVKIEH